MSQLIYGAPRRDARDVHPHVHAAVADVDVCGEGRYLVVVRDVQRPVLRHPRTECLRVCDRLLQPVGVAVGQIQLGALGSQLQRGRPADTAGRTGDEAPLAHETHCAAMPHSAISHSRSTISIARWGSWPRPTNALSPDSVIPVVPTSVRTSAGRSSEMGRAPVRTSCSTSATILSITVSSKSFNMSRISASVLRAILHARITGSLLANTVAAAATIRLAKSD